MSTALKIAPEPGLTAEPDETFLAQVRDRLALRSPRWERHRPRVLDLEALIVVDMHQETVGHSSALCGEQAPRHFRDAMHGDRELVLRTVCNLALSPNPAGGRAARRLQRRLDVALGRPVSVSLAEAAARLAHETADVHAATLRAIEDGATREELDRLDRELSELERAAAALRQTVAQLRAGAGGTR